MVENILVMNEVCNPDGTPHRSNSRAALVEIAEKFKEHKPWFGIEQEYTLMDGKQPAGWPEEGFPKGRKDLIIAALDLKMLLLAQW